MRFTGKPRDGETGLDYFGARYHAPRLGRFTTVDPLLGIPLALMDPQRWNRFSYVGNRPMRLVDPDGRGWISTLYRVAKAAVKGEDIYSAVSNVIDNATTIVSMDATVGTDDRLKATGGLLWDLSGAGDIVGGARKIGGILGAIDDAAGALRKGDRYRSPLNLMDQMALAAAKEGKGVKIIDSLGDPQFKGMEKWSYTEVSSSGHRTEVHYVRDPSSGSLMDFKFVYHPPEKR
jgi:RHS repeat-associated protein